MREANRQSTKIALLIGEDELSSESVLVKDMNTGEQYNISNEKLIEYLSNLDF